ncbi:MAG: DUF2029 domain-containing protein [Bacteroidetes bacterium]|nr:DUF2029 domain-containing protein [Bacteroidota bacterium]MBL0064789.1 DUF2029 domain-containing protein [Bacteroidota bacterium]
MLRKSGLYLLGIIILAYLVKLAMGDGDFKVFLEAAKLVKSGEDPYQKWIFIKEGHSCLYFYSPFFSLLLIPFSYLPNIVPNLLWLLFNSWCIYRIAKLLVHYIDTEILSTRQLQWILALTLLLNLRFILYNFTLIQVTLFLVWGMLESLRLFREGKFWYGGMLLALVINIKILPIVLLPYLIYRKEFKGAGITLFFLCIYFLLPAIFVGWDFNMTLHLSWWGTINPSNQEHLIEAGLGPHSLTALIPVLLTPSTGEIPNVRNIINLDPATAILIMNVSRLLLVVLTLLVLKLPMFTKVKSKPDELREIAYIFLIVPLIFPHQQKYAFVFLIPAIFYVATYMVSLYELKDPRHNRKFNYLLILSIIFFILTTLTTDGLIGKQLNQLSQHFKLVTYGTLFLVWILLLCKPEKLYQK